MSSTEISIVDGNVRVVLEYYDEVIKRFWTDAKMKDRERLMDRIHREVLVWLAVNELFGDDSDQGIDDDQEQIDDLICKLNV